MAPRGGLDGCGKETVVDTNLDLMHPRCVKSTGS